MERRGVSKKVAISLIIIVILFLILGIYFYFSFFYVDNTDINNITLENPAKGLSEEEAIAIFDKSFILYLLLEIGAQKLHNPPLSDNTPKIEIFIDNDVFNVEIIDEKIKIYSGEISGEDIRIRTTHLEAVRMIKGTSGIANSFKSGRSEIEVVGSEVLLFSKGYMKIYNRFNT